MKQIWWEIYLFYLGFESELKYYLPNLNWLLAAFSFLFLLIILIIIEKRLSTKIKSFSVIYAVIAAFYLTFVLSVTLFGRSPDSVSSWYTLFITYHNAIIDVPGARSAVFFNMVLFFPLGLLVSRYKNTKMCILFLTVLPIIIEFTQLITSVGVFEICDIINNFIGGMIGLGFARLVGFIFKFIKEKRKGGQVERAE